MRPELWTKVERLFLEAIELPADSRLRYARERGGDDHELTAAVQSLLLRYKSTSDFLSSPWRNSPSLDFYEFQFNPDELIASRFRVGECIGRGGMGLVLQAYDLLLKRDVALKVLPPEFTADLDRMRRFKAEAEITSGLRHPNILTIYDTGFVGSSPYIVSELLRGRSLRQRIDAGRLSVPEAIELARQIAAGLAAAHERGVVHRDVKPENLFLTDDGVVKIVDFGLAKVITVEPQQDIQSTRPGMILGTAGYMSPEQAHGEAADHRSDIFSFGAVLYEMLAGRPPYHGRSNAEMMLAVLRDEPPVFDADAGVSDSLDSVVRCCLRKEPTARIQSMTEVASALAGTASSPAGATRFRVRTRRALWAASGASILLLLGALATRWPGLVRRSAEGFGSGSFVPVPITSYPGFEIGPTLSPDRARVAFAWTGGELQNMDIYSKVIEGGAPVRLTSHPDRDFSPAWSPDGRWIAFLRALSDTPNRYGVFVIPSGGGAERTVAVVKNLRLGDFPRAGFIASWLSWSRDSGWLLASDSEPDSYTQRIVAFGLISGDARALTKPPPTGWGDLDPEVSPDGKSVAFARMHGYDSAQLYVMAIDENCRPAGEPRRISAFQAHMGDLAWGAGGSDLLFSVGAARRALWRVPVDGSKEPERINLLSDFASAATTGRDNSLVFVQRRSDSNIWRLSTADGARELLRPMASAYQEAHPQFSPDGRRIAYMFSAGITEIWTANIDGSQARRLAGGEFDMLAPNWSPDGRSIAFVTNSGGSLDIHVIPADGGKPLRLTDSPADDANPHWSKDGRWIYFSSMRTGRYEVFKMPAEGGAAYQVTTNGGRLAFESDDGKHLYYTKTEHGADHVWRRALDGGAESVVLAGVGQRIAVTRNGIWFFQKVEAGRTALRFFEFRGGRTRTVATLDGADVGDMTVSPDQLSVLYSQTDSEGSDLMMVKNFQ